MPYKTQLEYYISSFQSNNTTIASVMDMESALSVVTSFSGLHTTDIAECITGNIPNVFLYEKEEEKKSLGIEVIRRFLSEVYNKPYSGKALYLMSDIHTASIEAMNSLLKILEEPPEHAIIILITKEPNSLLETIQSRTIHLFHSQVSKKISQVTEIAIREYFLGNIPPLAQYLFEAKYDEMEALGILAFSIGFADTKMLSEIEHGMQDILHVNENPRNVLDRIFIAHS